MIYRDLIFITLIVVYIVDLSGFTDSWKAGLARWLHLRTVTFRPFDCSLCMTWWTGLIWAVVVKELTLPVIAYIALLSFLTYPIGEFLNLIKELLSALVRKLCNLLDKLE